MKFKNQHKAIKPAVSTFVLNIQLSVHYLYQVQYYHVQCYSLIMLYFGTNKHKKCDVLFDQQYYIVHATDSVDILNLLGVSGNLTSAVYDEQDRGGRDHNITLPVCLR